MSFHYVLLVDILLYTGRPMTNILLITHNHVGTAFLATVKRTLDTLPCQVQSINITQNANPDILITKVQKTLEEIDDGDGVLILTDMFGSTPSNIASHLKRENKHRVKLLSGLNLPMLMRAINYAHLTLAETAEKAFEGGRDGVCICTGKQKQNNKVSYDSKVCHDSE